VRGSGLLSFTCNDGGRDMSPYYRDLFSPELCIFDTLFNYRETVEALMASFA
jgi:hypothetical protein